MFHYFIKNLSMQKSALQQKKIPANRNGEQWVPVSLKIEPNKSKSKFPEAIKVSNIHVS
jgi:hypothetical protein